MLEDGFGNPNLPDHFGATEQPLQWYELWVAGVLPLHRAVQQLQIPTIQVLVYCGADVNRFVLQ